MYVSTKNEYVNADTVITGKPINKIIVGNTVYPISSYNTSITASIDELEELKKKMAEKGIGAAGPTA